MFEKPKGGTVSLKGTIEAPAGLFMRLMPAGKRCITLKDLVNRIIKET